MVRGRVEADYRPGARAFRRSNVWDPGARVDRSVLPTAGKMISDQTGIHVASETREEMARRYAPDL